MRFLRLADSNERVYDSCLPDYSEMINLTNENSQFTFNGDAVRRFFTSDLSNLFESDLVESKIKQFPYEGNPLRNVQVPAAIAASEGSDLISFPTNVTGDELDPLRIVYLTRYSFVSKAPAYLLPDYTRIIKPTQVLESYNPENYPTGIDLSSKLVSSYFMTSSANGTLYDLSGIENNLDLTPTFGGVTHLTPTSNASVPVQNLLNDGSLGFINAGSDTSVQMIAARVDIPSHKMSFSPGGIDFDIEFTMTMTFKRNLLGTEQYLLQRGDELGGTTYDTSYEMFINSSNQLVFRIYESTVRYKGINSNAFTLNSTDQWYNVTIVYNGEQTNTDGIDCLEMWINGDLVTPQSDNSSSPAPAGDPMQEDNSWRLWIGAGRQSSSVQPNSTKEFVGIMHSLHIWKSRMLTDVEVAALASAELYGTSLGAVSHRTTFLQAGSSRPIRSGTNRYGIANIEPAFTSAVFRPDHYGHFRDALEPRLHTATFDSEATIKIRFMSGSLLILDPTNTHAQNLSTFATSSMPYFDDGVARNRDDNPDETLLSV